MGFRPPKNQVHLYVYTIDSYNMDRLDVDVISCIICDSEL